MPTYDYLCKKCKKTFEEFQSITAPLLKKHPKCGGRLERLIGTGGGLIFKGSGFYATDYRKPEKKVDSKPDKKGEVCQPSPKDASKCEKPSCDKK